MSPRKRRHDQAFEENETEQQQTPTPEDGSIPDDDKERVDKEREVWEAIRETHYEAIEQLPLTLHRQLSLMRQLDEQTISCTSKLIPAVKEYVHQRRGMAGIFETELEIDASSVKPTPSSTSINERLEKSGLTIEEPPATALHEENSKSPFLGKPGSMGHATSQLVRSPEAAREILSRVGWLADEILRASQEKVNLAQANHDMVERHIRLIDQAIKEQEAALLIDPSNATNALVAQLPELVIPKYDPRKSRNGVRSGSDLDILSNVGDLSSIIPTTRIGEKNGTDQLSESTHLTITLPAPQPPNEELYCYCNRVSFGDMIACDGDSCEHEWFHLGCVGLTEIPEGEWHCEDCRIEAEML